MRLPRMTLRRRMIAVLVTSIVVKAATESETYRRLRSHHAAALRRYQDAARWFDEGRLDLVKTVLASERLMEAESGMSADTESQVAALEAHLRRADQFIAREKNEAPMCKYDPDMWIGIAERALVKHRKRLKTMNGARSEE
jgi:hypothetical protein